MGGFAEALETTTSSEKCTVGDFFFFSVFMGLCNCRPFPSPCKKNLPAPVSNYSLFLLPPALAIAYFFLMFLLISFETQRGEDLPSAGSLS